jgi:hypothetical protein
LDIRSVNADQPSVHANLPSQMVRSLQRTKKAESLIGRKSENRYGNKSIKALVTQTLIGWTLTIIELKVHRWHQASTTSDEIKKSPYNTQHTTANAYAVIVSDDDVSSFTGKVGLP